MRVDHRAVTRELCERRFYHFFKRAWKVLEPNRPLTPNWHIEYLCDVAEYEVRRIANREPKEHDYIVNMPFRSLKSMIFSVMLQPWAWIEYPWMRFTTVSYSSGLSMNHSNKSQKLMSSDWYKSHFGDCFNMRSDIQGLSKLKETEGYFENDKGGFRFVSSISGAATGYGGDINIADDILKAQDAESDAKRKSANEFWGQTYPSRVNDFEFSTFFLIMQRLHDDDPSGFSLNRNEETDLGGLFHINLPAENLGNVKPKPLVKYYENGLMFPERFNRKVLNDLEAKLGTLTYASQVNQKTQKPGGNLFQEDWFRKISRSEMPKRKYFDSITNYWDTAFTEKEKNSANAFIELGFKDGFVYVLNFAFRWLEFPELIKWMDAVEGVHKIEAKASGKSAAQVLQRMGITAIEVEIEGTDKRTRGNAISPHVEARKVFVPVDIWDSFLNDQRQGILKFPEGTHDDLGDAFVLGITDLLGIPRHLDRKNLDAMIEEEPSHVFNQ